MRKSHASLDWNDLRYLLTLAETGTLTATAQRLGVTQPTAGRRLAALERATGAPLFLRTARGHRLTPEGAALRDVAQELARRMGAFEHGKLVEHEAVGRVRVAVTEIGARHLLAHVAPRLAREHPGLELELVVGNALGDIASGDVDVALRLVAPEGARLVARRVGEQRYAVYGAPAYVRRAGTPKSVAELSEHRFVWPARELTRGPELGFLEALAPAPRVALRANSLPALALAIEAGLGLGVLPEPVGHDHAELRRVLPLPRALTRTVFVVYHEDARVIPRVRVAVEAIARHMGMFLRRAAS